MRLLSEGVALRPCLTAAGHSVSNQVETQAAEAELDWLLLNCFVRQILTRGVIFLLYADEQGEIGFQFEKATKVLGAELVANRHMRRFIVNPPWSEQIIALLRRVVAPRGITAKG